jgi:hypothetical protein
MTEEKVSLFPNNEPVRSAALLDKYFDDLDANKPIFIASLLDMNQHVHVYFESAENVSICKIFFSIEDVQLYIKHIVANTTIGGRSMRYWETTPDDFVNFLTGTGSSHAALRNRTLTAFSTAVMDGKIVTMDVFWSNDQRLMV